MLMAPLIGGRFPAAAGGGAVSAGLVQELLASEYSSGQTWADQSGNSRDMYLGSSSGADAADPAFTSGSPSYFSTAGGDYFSPGYTTTGDILRQIGRSDTPFTLEMWFYLPTAGTSNYYLWSNRNASVTGNGLAIYQGGPSSNLRLTGTNGTNNNGPSITASGWAQYVLTGQLDASTACQWYKDGATVGSTFTGATTTYSSGDAAAGPHLFSSSGGFSAYTGSRVGILRAYNRILSGAEVLENYDFNKADFGLS